ncbi:MAG: hypothetical protein H6732_13115 [Alphaproteobacteria bacterium]|nr:hypothetical protein [Alphaproteobacteria bacterium]
MWGLWLVPGALTAVAGAADIGVVGVFDPGLGPAEQEAVTRSVLAAVDVAAGHTGVGPDALATRLGAGAEAVLAEGALAEGRRRLADGRALLAAGRVDEALAALKEAREVQLEATVWCGSVEGLREAELALAEALQAAGRPMEAREALAAAASLRPDAEAPGLVAPLDRWFAEEVALGQEDLGQLQVRVEVAGAWVRVDGRGAGGPDAITSLPPGQHHVHVRAGDRVGYRAVLVDPGGLTTVTVPLGPPLLGPSGQAPGPLLADLVGALAEAAELDAVWVAGAAEGGRAARLYVRATGGFTAPVAASGSAAAGLVATVAPLLAALPDGGNEGPPSFSVASNAVLTRVLRTPPPVAVDAGLVEQAATGAAPATEPRQRSPAKKKASLWIGIGVAIAAAAVVGTAVGVSATNTGDPPPPSGTIVVALPR